MNILVFQNAQSNIYLNSQMFTNQNKYHDSSNYGWLKSWFYFSYENPTLDGIYLTYFI